MLKMQYPLTEKIGNPELLVGREKEFTNFNKWISMIPDRLSKSRVILARRKSGKTAFVQRIFNQLWSANGAVIPFYFEIADNKIWYPDFAVKYYRSFASQYISFLERDSKLVQHPLTLEKIKEYGLAKSNQLLVDDVEDILNNKEMGLHDSMWEIANAAPHRFAGILDIRFLVILDEFQNISKYVYPDKDYKADAIDTLAGSYHSYSESKVAPMLVTGSYLGLILDIINKYLEAGRLSRFFMKPYLTPEEGLQAVYKYAEFYQQDLSLESAIQINELCMYDPFFISCVIQSNYENKDLRTVQGVVDTVNYEISDRNSEMSVTWGEYIEAAVERINDKHAKHILLHLSKHNQRYWTPQEVKDYLNLELGVNEVHRKMLSLVASDLLVQGVADIDFRGLQDGTLNLILRTRFEKEINNFEPDLKTDFLAQIQALKTKERQLQGMINHLSGKLAESQLALAFLNKKSFALSDFFQGVVDDTPLTITKVKQRVSFEKEAGKVIEFDVMAESESGRVVLVEVKKTKSKIGLKVVKAFEEKLAVFGQLFPETKILPAFFSVGGFTQEALDYCRRQGIATAEIIKVFS